MSILTIDVQVVADITRPLHNRPLLEIRKLRQCHRLDMPIRIGDVDLGIGRRHIAPGRLALRVPPGKHVEHPRHAERSAPRAVTCRVKAVGVATVDRTEAQPKTGKFFIRIAECFRQQNCPGGRNRLAERMGRPRAVLQSSGQ